MNRQKLPLATLASFVGIVGAAPIDMVIDPAQSSIELNMTVDVSIASDSDTDSSPLSGSLRVEFDDAGNPTEISLSDLFVNIDQTLNFNWSFGFFGGADAALSSGAVTWGSIDSIVGPVPINEGNFVLPDVPLALQGTLAVNYDIFLVGMGSETVNLGDQGDFFSQIEGSVSVSGDMIIMTSTLPLDATTPLVDGSGTELGTLTVSGTATIVATGTAPSCPADLTGDGELNFFDVSAFLTAYNTQDPIADFTGDGVFNFFDVSAFLNAFNAGCL
jgi:hypothetical protein